MSREASSSDLPTVRLGMEASQEQEYSPPSQSATPVPVEPPPVQPQGQNMPELVGMITQAVVAAMTSSSSHQTKSLDADKMVEKARRLGAQEFQGTTDPVQAGNWFRKTERVLEMMKCSDEQKLSIATFLLEGRAENWWMSVISRQPQGVEMTWGDFKKEFYQQYHSGVYISQKRKEFLSLKQGKLSVAEYEATFNELSHFAEALVADEKEKCSMFEDGLNLQIKAKTGMQSYNSYSELVQGALKAEEIEKEFLSRRQEKFKRSAPSAPSGAGGTQQFKRPQRSGQYSYTFKAPTEVGRGSASVSVSSQSRGN